MKPIALSDILHYRFLSNLRFSRSGERAAFVVATADEENNAYEQRLWLYEQGRVRQLTDLGKEGRFQWLDENRLLFPAVRSAKEKKRAEGHEEFTSYYVLDLSGNHIELLQPLNQLTGLKKLYLTGNPLSEDQLEALRAALPDCEIVY